jgi:hypothetical protein
LRVCFEVSISKLAQDRVHAGLIAVPLRFKPLQNINVDAQCDLFTDAYTRKSVMRCARGKSQVRINRRGVAGVRPPAGGPYEGCATFR